MTSTFSIYAHIGTNSIAKVLLTNRTILSHNTAWRVYRETSGDLLIHVHFYGADNYSIEPLSQTGAHP